MAITRAKTGEAIIDGVFVPQACMRAYDLLKSFKRPVTAIEVFEFDCETNPATAFPSLTALHSSIRRLEQRGLVRQSDVQVKSQSGKMITKVMFEIASGRRVVEDDAVVQSKGKGHPSMLPA